MLLNELVYEHHGARRLRVRLVGAPRLVGHDDDGAGERAVDVTEVARQEKGALAEDQLRPLQAQIRMSAKGARPVARGFSGQHCDAKTHGFRSQQNMYKPQHR